MMSAELSALQEKRLSRKATAEDSLTDPSLHRLGPSLQASIGVYLLPLAACVFLCCAHGPRVKTGYDRETGERKVETDDNRLEGSYWKHAVPHNLDIDASVYLKSDGTERILLTVIYHAVGRVFDGDDGRLVLEADARTIVRQPTHVENPREWVTERTTTGEVVSRSGKFFEAAIYEIARDELLAIAGAHTCIVRRLGSRSPTDWRFGEKNFRAYRQLIARAYPEALSP